MNMYKCLWAYRNKSLLRPSFLVQPYAMATVARNWWLAPVCASPPFGAVCLFVGFGN